MDTSPPGGKEVAHNAPKIHRADPGVTVVGTCWGEKVIFGGSACELHRGISNAAFMNDHPSWNGAFGHAPAPFAPAPVSNN